MTPISYAVRWGGVVHSSLDPALEQYEEMRRRTGQASLATTPDTRYAAHFAAGHNHREAKRLADGERLAAAWRTCSPADPQLGAIEQKLHALAARFPKGTVNPASISELTESTRRFQLNVDNGNESDEYPLGGNISSGDEFDEGVRGE
jgi:hypothetical protein